MMRTLPCEPSTKGLRPEVFHFRRQNMATFAAGVSIPKCQTQGAFHWASHHPINEQCPTIDIMNPQTDSIVLAWLYDSFYGFCRSVGFANVMWDDAGLGLGRQLCSSKNLFSTLIKMNQAETSDPIALIHPGKPPTACHTHHAL